jgi:hypothetical protein
MPCSLYPCYENFVSLAFAMSLAARPGAASLAGTIGQGIF